MTSQDPVSQSASSLDVNMTAYERMQDILEEEYMYKWVIFHNEEFVDVYDSLDFAAYHATQEFGNETFLIRQVGQISPVRMSSLIQYGL